MDREDVERLVRVEEAVVRIDATVSRLERRVLVNTNSKTALDAVTGFLVKIVPFGALGVALAALLTR